MKFSILVVPYMLIATSFRAIAAMGQTRTDEASIEIKDAPSRLRLH